MNTKILKFKSSNYDVDVEGLGIISQFLIQVLIAQFQYRYESNTVLW